MLSVRMSIRGCTILVALLACAAARASADDAAGLEFFESKVRPLLVDTCFKCHSSSAEKLKGALRLDSRATALKGGESGDPAITPGKPDDSKIILAVRYEDEGLQMPPKKKLAPEQIATLETWVKMGAPYPAND